MKRSVLFLLASLVLLPGVFAAGKDSLLARVTVYWARGGRGADRYTSQHKSSTGARLQQGHCAVDPKKIPYGSRVLMPDGSSLSAVDTGSAVRSRKAARRLGRNSNERNALVIDKFFETKRQAMAWANSNPPFVNVKVVPPNAPAIAKPNLTNSQPIALAPAAASPPTATSSNPIAKPVMAVITPTGAVVRNPLGRLGR